MFYSITRSANGLIPYSCFEFMDGYIQIEVGTTKYNLFVDTQNSTGIKLLLISFTFFSSLPGASPLFISTRDLNNTTLFNTTQHNIA